jgi:hypothetical protein
MAIENLPRPWFLAALTGLRVAQLLGPDKRLPSDRPPQRPLPRPESRRRRPDETPGHYRRLRPLGDRLN